MRLIFLPCFCFVAVLVAPICLAQTPPQLPPAKPAPKADSTLRASVEAFCCIGNDLQCSCGGGVCIGSQLIQICTGPDKNRPTTAWWLHPEPGCGEARVTATSKSGDAATTVQRSTPSVQPSAR